MAASYPNAIPVFSTKHNFSDTVDASDPNALQNEVVAIEQTLGTNPQVGTVQASTALYDNTGKTFATVGARLANVEAGIVADTHTQYLHKAGGDTLTPSTNSVALKIQSPVGQTANLIEGYDNTGALQFVIDANYNLTTRDHTVVNVNASGNISGNALAIQSGSAAGTFSAGSMLSGGASVITTDFAANSTPSTGPISAGSSSDYARADHSHGPLVSVASPTGAVTMYAASTAPSGWLLCDGSAVSRTAYSALFAVIGTAFGPGDGANTFNVPDLRGRIAVGAGSGPGLLPRSLGATGGEETHTITQAEMPAHSHNATASSYSSTHSHTGTTDTYAGQSAIVSATQTTVLYGPTTPAASTLASATVGSHSHTVSTTPVTTTHSHTVSVDSTGSGNPVNVMQPWVGLTYIIKA